MAVVPILTIALVLLVKEAGIPIPVPGDLLVIGAGVSTAGKPEAIVWLAAILLAGYVGGCIQFGLIRGPARGPLLAGLARFGVGEERLARVAAPLARQGARGVAVARMTPAVRVPVIAASAVAAIPFGVFARGLVAGNTVFVGGHFLLGYAVGAPATRIAGAIASPVVAAAIVAVLAIAGAVAWALLRHREATPALAWADAACPACLAIAAFGRGTALLQPSAEADVV